MGYLQFLAHAQAFVFNQQHDEQTPLAIYSKETDIPALVADMANGQEGILVHTEIPSTLSARK